MLHRLEFEQILPITIEEAWGFFSNPMNLNSITPSSVKFEIISGAERAVHTGQILCYRIQIAPLVKVNWVTEIKAVTDFSSFVDEQRFGPFLFWHHRHTFEKVDGGVKVHDLVHYGMPFWIIGKIAHWLWVKRQNQSIFRFRQQKLRELFPG